MISLRMDITALLFRELDRNVDQARVSRLLSCGEDERRVRGGILLPTHQR